jgi:hypothetical protein
MGFDFKVLCPSRNRPLDRVLTQRRQEGTVATNEINVVTATEPMNFSNMENIHTCMELLGLRQCQGNVGVESTGTRAHPKKMRYSTRMWVLA